MPHFPSSCSSFHCAMLSDSCSASSLNKGTWLAIFWKHGSTRKCPKPTWVFASAATCRKSRQESARHQAGVRTGEAVLVLYAGDSCGPDGAARRQGLAHARGSRGTGHPGWTGTRTQLRRRHDDRRAVSGASRLLAALPWLLAALPWLLAALLLAAGARVITFCTQ